MKPPDRTDRFEDARGAAAGTPRRWPGIVAALLVAAAFFEGGGYSFHFLGMRVRSVQLLEVASLGLLGVLWLLGKWRWRRSPLDPWLLAYLGISAAAILNSGWRARSLKIFLLLVTLVLLYWLVFQLLRGAAAVTLAFRTFMVAGTAQVLFGLYQVLAGAMNHYRGWRLPVGHLGTVHRQFLDSVWGRPYGTQVEPDYYGAICMAMALFFIVLLFSGQGKGRKWLLGGALLALLGLYLSFVRMSWLGFLFVLPLLVLFRKRFAFSRLAWVPLLLIIAGAAGFHLLSVHAIHPIQRIVQARFSMEPSPPGAAAGGDAAGQIDGGSLLNSQNVRLQLIGISLQSWKAHPILGNGPGSFAYVYWRSRAGEAEARRLIRGKAAPFTNPSLVFAVLGDTGILGLIVFLLLAAKLLLMSLKRLSAPPVPLTPWSFALFASLAALFFSYLLSNGMWLPLTWVLLGVHVAALESIAAGGDERQPAGPGAP
jgi:O-antigen ligase